MNYLPGLILSLLSALLIGFLSHFIKGGGLLRLLTIELFSIMGFIFGHLIAGNQDVQILKIGWVNFGPGILGSIVFSLIALWITKLNLDK